MKKINHHILTAYLRTITDSLLILAIPFLMYSDLSTMVIGICAAVWYFVIIILDKAWLKTIISSEPSRLLINVPSVIIILLILGLSVSGVVAKLPMLILFRSKVMKIHVALTFYLYISEAFLFGVNTYNYFFHKKNKVIVVIVGMICIITGALFLSYIISNINLIEYLIMKKTSFPDLSRFNDLIIIYLSALTLVGIGISSAFIASQLSHSK